jgi:propanol-preferring alcohol dehydrogenase
MSHVVPSSKGSPMRAVVFLGPGRAELVDRPRPGAAPGWVVLQVLAAGVCQTDVHLRRGSDARTVPGRVLGHEVAGEVVELGDGVTGWAPGQRVAVYPAWSCLTCPACQSGRRNACLRTGGRRTTPTTPGISADGGMAEHVAVPASALADIGTLDPAVAATMTDAALSPYGALSAVRHLLHPGSCAVVIGVGGLGSMAVQELRATTATRVIALDVDDQALAAAQPWTDHVLRSDAPDAVDTVLGWTGGAGAAAVFDFVGTDRTLALAADVVAPFGAVQVTGMGGGTLAVQADATSRLPRGATIAPRLFSGSYPDLLEVLALARDGALRPTLTRFPFEAAVEALDALESGAVQGRAVLEL